MKHILMISVGALAVMTLTANAAIIDNFGAATMGVEDPSGGTFPTSTLENITAIDCVGGFRRMTAARVTGTNGSIIVVANSPLYVDKASMYMSGDTTGTGIFEYGSFTTSAGDLDLDLSADGFFGIAFGNSNEDIAALITVTNEEGPVSFSTTIPSAPVGLVYRVLFSSFGGFDFTNVDGIQYKFTALVGSTSLILDTLNTSPIPEPASLALFGLLSLGLLRRRR